MAKRTKQEKIIADLRRKLRAQEEKTVLTPSKPSRKTEETNVKTESRPSAISLTPATNLIKKDLIKTFFLSIVAISLELVLYLIWH